MFQRVQHLGELRRVVHPHPAHASGLAQPGQLRARGGAEDPLEGRGAVVEASQAIPAGFQGLEDRATVVVGDHNHQVLRAGLIRTKVQAVDVMKKRKVPQQGERPRGADRRRIGGGVRQGRAHRGGHQAVDARGTTVGDRAHPVEGQAHPGDIADRRGGANEQRIPVAQGIRQHRSHVQPGERPVGGGLSDAVSHRPHPQLGHTAADLKPGLR